MVNVDKLPRIRTRMTVRINEQIRRIISHITASVKILSNRDMTDEISISRPVNDLGDHVEKNE